MYGRKPSNFENSPALLRPNIAKTAGPRQQIDAPIAEIIAPPIVKISCLLFKFFIFYPPPSIFYRGSYNFAPPYSFIFLLTYLLL